MPTREETARLDREIFTVASPGRKRGWACLAYDAAAAVRGTTTPSGKRHARKPAAGDDSG
jgi:hypothetical protein